MSKAPHCPNRGWFLFLSLIGLMSVAALPGHLWVHRFSAGASSTYVTSPSWSITGSLNIPSSGHTATLLPNGKVLVAGGYAGYANFKTAELYDPVIGNGGYTRSLNTARSSHTATLLPNGKVLVVGGASQLSTATSEGQIAPDQPSSLQVTARIIKQDYCVGDSELDGVRLRLKLIYTNKTKEPVIVEKGGPLVPRIMVSRSIAEASANRFEVNASQTEFTTGGDKCYGGARPNKCFVVLAPGASYETEVGIRAFVVKENVREIVGVMKAGPRVLQVQVLPWISSKEMAKKLQTRWAKYGSLWLQPLITAPTPFEVPVQRKLIECQ